jgi:CheY-like chemotaxis protein
MSFERFDPVASLALGAAHDFKNLLFVIATHTDRIAQTLEPEDARHRDVEAIHSASSRALAVAQQVLAAGRGGTPVVRPLNVNDVVRGLGDLLTPLVGDRIALAIELEEDLWLVRANRTQVEQIVINLVINARDAMPDGGTITVATGNQLHTAPGGPERWIDLMVRDTGIGMSADIQAQMFDPYFTTKGTGTGLGLAGVHEIVTSVGGRIDVESTPGEGTTMTVRIPSVTRATHADVTTMPTRPTDRPLRVLVIEDERPIRELLVACLRQEGYDTSAASSGAEARDLCADIAFDLIVTDLQLPDASGCDLARQIREEAPHLPVVFMSGAAEAVPEAAVGPGLLLAKPFSIAEFRDAIASALSIRRVA